MYEDAEFDEEVQSMLEGTDGDPEKIREKMDAYMNATDSLYERRTGVASPMRVTFREVDTFNLWIWLQLYSAPSSREADMLATVLKSWFMVGKLGGYNTMNMQVFHSGEDDVSYLKYDAEEQDDAALGAFFHSMTDLEQQGEWCRVNVDMGTGDELSLDVLVNMLAGFNTEHLGIRRLVIGGVNKEWPVPVEEEQLGDIDPMSVQGAEEEEADGESQFDEAFNQQHDFAGIMGGQEGSGYSVEDVPE